MKKYLKNVGVLLCVLLLAACANNKGSQPTKPTKRDAVQSDEIQFAPQEADAVTGVISTTAGDINIVLYPKYAPQAVENFIGLANEGYFNGISFHRVVKNQIIQSGDDTATGAGGTTIWNGSPFGLELTDTLHHYSGALSMARVTGDTNSNKSQFFIVQTPQNNIDKDMQKALADIGAREEVINAYKAAGGLPSLDGEYTVFGQVITGMEAVDAIGFSPVDGEKPVEDIIINSITIN